MSSLYIGTGAGKIYLSTFDEATGGFSPARAVSECGNSFFLARHPSEPVLYSLDEKGGAIDSFRMEGGGALTFLGRVSSQGKVPCHLEVDRHGRYLVVANYGGGVALFPLQRDGSVAEAVAVLTLGASRGPSPRQEASHPHGVLLDPDLNLIYIADLGCDRISVLRLIPETWTLQLAEELAAQVAPGAGPRHVAFVRDGRALLSVNELDNTVSFFARDSRSGRLSLRESVPTLPPDFSGTNWAAELICHPRGKRCYATNRGHDSVVSFPIDGNGEKKFQPPVWTAAGGKGPQHLAFDAAAAHLFIANKDSDEVAVQPLDRATGLPWGKPGVLSVPKPMSVLVV